MVLIRARFFASCLERLGRRIMPTPGMSTALASHNQAPGSRQVTKTIRLLTDKPAHPTGRYCTSKFADRVAWFPVEFSALMPTV